MFRTGDTIGRYQVLARLGAGGMGDIYLATAPGVIRTQNLFALKLLKRELAADPSFVGMFMHEAALASRLEHPSIVRIEEASQAGPYHYIAMEYVQGQNLRAALQRAEARGEPFPLAVSVSVLRQVLGALHAAHGAVDIDGSPLAIIHRDVTPSNVLLGYDGRVVLVDFGIAKAMALDPRTQTGVLKGTMTYVSPERVRGEAVDHRADLYAVGVILRELLTGRRLFAEMEQVAMFHRLVRGEIPPIEALPGTPEPLIRAATRAMSPDPSDRYPDANAMIEDLDEYLHAAPESEGLGAIMSRLFAPERERVSALIHKQLKATRVDQVNESLPGLDFPSSSDPDNWTDLDQEELTSAATPRSVRRSHRGPSMPVVGALFSAVLGMALALALWLPSPEPALRGDDAGEEEEPAHRTDLEPSPVTTRTPAEVRLQVSVEPASARVTLDEVEVGLVSMHEPSPEARLLRASADGFEAATREVVLTTDRDVSITLRRSQVPPPAPTAAPVPSMAGPTRRTPGRVSAQVSHPGPGVESVLSAQAPPSEPGESVAEPPGPNLGVPAAAPRAPAEERPDIDLSNPYD